MHLRFPSYVGIAEARLCCKCEKSAVPVRVLCFKLTLTKMLFLIKGVRGMAVDKLWHVSLESGLPIESIEGFGDIIITSI